MLPYSREHKPDEVEWLEGRYSACQTHYNHLTLNKFYNTGQ